MALTGINFCKPSVVDTKKQNSRPIFQPLRLLSSASSTMHQTRHHDFPFVPLTGHKLVDDPCIPSSFDIMDDHTNFEGDYPFVKSNHFANARTIFKNASFKGCHQFPMISISQLVGGFVGSKSQVRAKNREPHQIWDIVFRKLDEFVNSKPVERYTEHCYEFQTLSQNLIGSLYEESGSALGLAASYILADSGHSFKNTKPTSNIAKSSPTADHPVEIIPTPVDTFVSSSRVLPSHSPNSPSSVPVIFNIVEHLISQSDLSNRDTIVSDPLKFTRVQHQASPFTFEPSPVFNILGKPPSSKDPLLEEPSSRIPSEVKQSYAEVAKMAHGRSLPMNDHRQTRWKSSSKRYRKVNNHYFVRSCNDSRQRCDDTGSTNWRDPAAGSSERKDLRRDHFTPAHSGAKSAIRPGWRCERKSESLPNGTFQPRRRKKRDELKGNKPCRVTLKTVHEFTSPTSARETVNHADATDDGQSPPCQFYNPNKRSCCTNWRCRQLCQFESSAKRNSTTRYVLAEDNISGDDDRTPNSDASPSPDGNGDISINAHDERCVASDRPPCDNVAITNPSVRHLPILDLDVPARPRCLSETAERCGVQTPKERSLSEGSETSTTKSVPRSRSISEASSSGSTSSCKPEAASPRGRFSSECDSEDSFVIFEGGSECLDYDSSSLDSDASSDDEDFDSDEPDACARVSLVFHLSRDDLDLDPDLNSFQCAKLREVNKRWDADTSTPLPARTTPCKKAVRFACGPRLATVHPMVKWAHAYRSARRGPWEEMARDRERFRQRIERSEPTLTAVLGAEHREAVRGRLEAAGRHDIR